MRHSSNSGTTILRAHGLRKGDEHPIYAPVEYGTLYILLYYFVGKFDLLDLMLCPTGMCCFEGHSEVICHK